MELGTLKVFRVPMSIPASVYQGSIVTVYVPADSPTFRAFCLDLHYNAINNTHCEFLFRFYFQSLMDGSCRFHISMPRIDRNTLAFDWYANSLIQEASVFLLLQPRYHVGWYKQTTRKTGHIASVEIAMFPLEYSVKHSELTFIKSR